MSTPVVDVAAKTVTHAGTTFIMRPLSDDAFTVMVGGVPVGRAVYSFGANAVVESPDVTEEVLTAVAEAWFAAIEPGVSLSMVPVAHVRGGRTSPTDDRWDEERCVLEFDARFGPDALAGLDAFSHLEVVFVFDRVDEAKIETGARHPRERADWPLVGIFAQRGRTRPNRLGVSRCRLLRVEGTRVHVQGLDAIDGTPVLDIKPYMREFGPRGEVVQPQWATELMAQYY